MKIFQKGQVSLEIALVFVAVLLFLLGMLRVFFWANNDLVARQKDYLQTRDEQGRWPIHRTANLTDDNVFKGNF